MFRFLVLAFLAVASADIVYDGPCQEVKPVENFNFSAYQGLWYEVARYPNAGEEGDKGKCTTAEYTVDGENGKAKNSHVVDGVKYYIEGDLKLVGPSQVRITYTFGGVSKDSYLTILDTDYKSYSIGYSCKYFKETNKHQVFSWIKSRSKIPEAAAKETVENYLKDSKILKKSNYVVNDHSDATCGTTIAKRIEKFLD
ncbi:unnamed protein product, partial [Iphiclides podalirius]